MITRALGTDPDVDVDTFTSTAEIGDVFLLCSDGLTDMVSESGDPRRRRAQPRRHRRRAEGARQGGEPRRRRGQHHRRRLRDRRTESLAHDGDTREQALPASRRRRGHADGSGRRACRRHGRDLRRGDPGRARRTSGERACAAATCAAASVAWLGAAAARRGGRRRRLPEVRRAEPAQPGARVPDRRRRADGDRVRQRLHRAAGRRLDGLADVCRLLLRALPRGAPRRALHGAVRRSVPAADRRPADGDRPDGDLPARARRRVQARHLDRRRRRALRR